MTEQEKDFLYKSLAIMFVTPVVVIIFVPLLLYVIFLPFIAIGAFWGEGNWRHNFVYYSKWFIGLFFKNPSPSGRI
ncbi:MAG: hypothetical protein V4642_09060 [Bacteroidota bacterium]